eukprot:353687-Chlamydomonas_euryale.AAC.2
MAGAKGRTRCGLGGGGGVRQCMCGWVGWECERRKTEGREADKGSRRKGQDTGGQSARQNERKEGGRGGGKGDPWRPHKFGSACRSISHRKVRWEYKREREEVVVLGEDLLHPRQVSRHGSLAAQL